MSYEWLSNAHDSAPDRPAGRRAGVFSDPDYSGSAESSLSPEGETSRDHRDSRPGGAAIQAQEVMTRNVEVAHPDDTIQEAAEKMRAFGVGPLPVCEAGRLVGILTDRDITVRATAAGCDPARTKVRDVMTADVLFCYLDQDVAEAARLMQQGQVRRLAVLDRARRFVGILSLGDLAVSGGDDCLSGATLERISERAEPEDQRHLTPGVVGRQPSGDGHSLDE